MLTNAQAIRDMLLSEPSRKKLNGKTVIQMGTIAPSESRAIQDEVVAAGRLPGGSCFRQHSRGESRQVNCHGRQYSRAI